VAVACDKPRQEMRREEKEEEKKQEKKIRVEKI
jgi:hypothetical protein